MKQLSLVADKAKTAGIIRNILGMNNSPRIYFQGRLEREKELFRALNPVRVRYHDAAIENPGFALVDVSRIFPLFHTDENDPANYDFKPTDCYLRQAVECGAKIEIRLGETIEHSPEQFRVHPPSDPEKWARICINIIRHYNEGWGGGMRLGIGHVSIWEEPDTNPMLFTGSFEQYLELYATASRKLREAFPALKIGGPNTGFGLAMIERFLAGCAKNRLPVDFLCVTCYSRDPEAIAERIRQADVLLKKYGFPKAEISLSEWHYGPAQWGTDGHFGCGEFYRTVSGAFCVSSLIRFLDTPLSVAYYYSWALGHWGLFDERLKPYPVYHALAFFAEMAACVNRLEVSGGTECVDVLAGTAENGKVKMLLSCFKSEAVQFFITVPGTATCRVRTLADGCPMEPRELKQASDGSFVLTFEDGGSAVYLLELG